MIRNRLWQARGYVYILSICMLLLTTIPTKSWPQSISQYSPTTPSFYNRPLAVKWAKENNSDCHCYRGKSDGRYCTTYVGRALHAGGLNTSTNWTGNRQIVRWMLDNPDAWEDRPLNQLVEGDFVLYSRYDHAPGNWSYLDPKGGWSLWGHSAFVIAPGRVAAWNAEYKNVSITAFTSLPYHKGVHILDHPVPPGSYQDQGTLPYRTTKRIHTDGAEHRWTLSTSSVDRVMFDIKRKGGNLTYRLILKKGSQTIVDTRSSCDGRGIIPLANVGSGTYYLHIIPDSETSGDYELTAYNSISDYTAIPNLRYEWGDGQTAYTNVRRWQAPVGTTSTNFYVKWMRTCGNYEIDWELRRRSDGRVLNSGSSENGQAIASTTASDWVDFHITQVTGNGGSYRLGIYKSTPSLPDITMPTGHITTPSNGSYFNGDMLQIEATATDEPGGSGIKDVSFWIRYGAPYAASWHLVNNDVTYPYSAVWNVPSGLRSQLVEIGIHVQDNAENYCIDPDPSGYYCGSEMGKRIVEYYEPLEDLHTLENWVPKDWRFYLNQRSLDPDTTEADKRCSGASASMVLAMLGVIDSDYDTMKSTANEIYADIKGDQRASRLSTYLNENYPAISTEDAGYNIGAGWDKIIEEIDSGRPLILVTPKLTEKGHYIVIVGYRYNDVTETGDLIVYDPFGKWEGEKGAYNGNSPSPSSFKGQWAYYKFEDVWGQESRWPWNWNKGYLITVRQKTALQESSETEPVEYRSTPPDLISDEEETILTYEGVEAIIEYVVFLPLVQR